jgi:GNAT superfamily N-acetyltransferase
MKYTIRKVTNNDKKTLVSLSRKTINSNFRSFMGDEAVDTFINSGMADKEITDNINNISVLQLNNEIIGLCIWKDNLLHLMMIDPDYQGSGAASYFIDHMSHEKLQEYDEIFLECFENNIRANAFYRKCGWIMYKKELDADFDWYRLFYKKQRSE